MGSELATTTTTSDADTTTEFSVTIDGVIELPSVTDEKAFFDGLLDAIIAYVEQHQGLAGLSLSHQPYEESDDCALEGNEANDGGQDSENG